MLKEAQAAVTEFHALVDQPIGAPLSIDAQLRLDLIGEELAELSDALTVSMSDEDRRVAVADALGDLAYVVIGSAVTWGIPLDRVFEAIHRSNLSKTIGGVVKRPDGKILKGPSYVPPDIRGALEIKP